MVMDPMLGSLLYFILQFDIATSYSIYLDQMDAR